MFVFFLRGNVSNARGSNEEAYEYEQQRLANIAKIKEKPESLKLPSLNNSVPPRQPSKRRKVSLCRPMFIL
jgi:hypothetical protein